MAGDGDTGGQATTPGSDSVRGEAEDAVWAGLTTPERGSPLGVLALLVARRLDEGVQVFYTDDGQAERVQVSARDTAGMVKELRAVLADIRDHPVGQPAGESELDKARSARDRRRAGPDRTPAP